MEELDELLCTPVVQNRHEAVSEGDDEDWQTDGDSQLLFSERAAG